MGRGQRLLAASLEATQAPSMTSSAAGKDARLASIVFVIVMIDLLSRNIFQLT